MSTPITDLSLEERLKLVEDLWDSIAADQERLPLTREQRAELDERLDEFELDGDLGLPAAEVLAQIRRAL
jgi:putative addiction module component (TIGR02574 family)